MFLYFCKALRDGWRQRRRVSLQAFQIHQNQRDSLSDVVMKLSGDPRSFLFLSLDQFAAHVGERLFRQFVVSDVDTGADVARKGTLLKLWDSLVKNPAILSIMSPKPILHFESLAPVERVGIGFQTSVQVLGMDTFRPAVSQRRLNGTTRELQPGLIEVGTELFWTRHPNHHRSGVCHQ